MTLRCASGIIFFIGTVCCLCYVSQPGGSVSRQNVDSANNSDKECENVNRNHTSADETVTQRTGQDEGSSSTQEEATGSSLRRCKICVNIRQRPEIGLWFFGNLTGCLGLNMPFVFLVGISVEEWVTA